MSDATYRQLIDVAFDAAGRASLVMSRTRFTDRTQARAAVAAYRDVFAAIATQLSYLTNTGTTVATDDVISVPDPLVARATDAIAGRGRRGSAAPRLGEPDPLTRAWRETAAGLRAAADLLDTHRGPDKQWRTPDAKLLDQPGFTAGAVTALADLARTLVNSGQVLALRAREVTPGDTHSGDLLNPAPILIAAAGLRAYARTHAPIGDIGDLRPAHTVGQPAPASTPLGPAAAGVAVLRQRAWEHTRDPTVSIRTLGTFAAAAVIIHQHAAVITAAAAARYLTLAGFTDDRIVDVLQDAAATSSAAADSWRQVHQHCQGLHSPTPPAADIRDQVVHLQAALNVVTRSGNQWRSTDQLVPDLRAANILLRDIQRLIGPVNDIAGWYHRVIGVLAENRQIYAPAREMNRDDVSEDPELVRARLANKLAPIPPRQAGALLADYARAGHSSEQNLRAHATGLGLITDPTRAAPAETTNLVGLAVNKPARVAAVSDWQRLLIELAPAASTDPHTPTLMAALARAADAGHNPDALLRTITRGPDLPADHTARTLHYRLTAICEAAITPATPAQIREADEVGGPAMQPTRPQDQHPRPTPRRSR